MLCLNDRALYVNKGKQKSFFNRENRNFCHENLSSFNVFNISGKNSLKLNKIDKKLFLHNLAFTTKVHFCKNWHPDVYRSEMIFYPLT